MSFTGNASVTASQAALRLLSSATYQTAFVEATASTPDGGGGTYAYVASNTSGCVFTASVSGTTLTVTAVASGTLSRGLSVNRGDTGVSIGTIVALGTGTGGTGTYTISASATISSMTFTADSNSNFLVAVDGGRWFKVGLYPLTAAEQAAGVTPENYQYAPYTLLRYGADPTGANSSTTALQDAINCAQEAGYAMVTVGVAGATLNIGSAWSINTNLTGIDFQGAYVNASAFTSGYWLSPTQSLTDVNQRAYVNQTHPICNATFVGPGTAVIAATCLYLNDTTTPTPLIAGLQFRNLAFINWAQDVVMANGAFAERFDGCAFGVNVGGGGAGTTYGITNMGGSTNAGERNLFTGCAWYNKAFILNQSNGESDIYFIGCSLDTAQRAVYANGGNVFLIGCHLEASEDTDYYLYATGNNSSIYVQGCEVVFDVKRSNYALAYSDPSIIWGGVFIDSTVMGAASGYDVPLIAGGGTARAQMIQGIGTAAGQPLYYSAYQSLIAQPNFGTNTFTADGWTASGGSAPTIVNNNAYAGSYSVEFNIASGAIGTLTSRTFPCKPGQRVCVELFAKLTTYNSGAGFIANISYVDQGGQQLPFHVGGTQTSTFQFMSIAALQTTYTGYSNANSGGMGPAPPGTVGVVLSIEGVGNGAMVGYLGQVILTID